MAQHTQKKPPAEADLVARLAPALRTGGAGPEITVIDQPLIGSRYRHVTVVWDAWEKVPLDQRSKVILDAYERANPQEPWRVLEITLAVGLTPVEARKLKIVA